MKSLLIAIKPIYCVLIMNGDKTIEVRKNKALASAIQKLIDENGYANIYVYCCKNGVDINGIPTELVDYRGCAIYNRFQLMRKGAKLTSDDEQPRLNGKVLFKFRCYKIEELVDYGSCYLINKDYPHTNKVARQSCLDFIDLKNYLKGENGYAINISDLEIFDEPKELSEFKYWKDKSEYGCWYENKLTKAPQNMIYIEVENNE